MRQLVKDFVMTISQTLLLPEPVYEFGSFQVEGQEDFANLRLLFPGRKYFGCDMRPGKGVDLILDLHNIELSDETAGTVLMIDTLEHVEFCRKAVSEVYRILKPGGILIITSVMKFPIHEYPNDYWRFTPEGFRSLLNQFSFAYVDYIGEKSFPHTVVGIGIKEKTVSSEEAASISHAIGVWKDLNTQTETLNPAKESLKLFIPPILLKFYRWIRR